MSRTLVPRGMSALEALHTSENPYPVMPGGYLMGSFIAVALFALHTTQLRHFFTTHLHSSWRTQLLVLWVYTLSVCQIVIILGGSWHYFVGGLGNPEVWGTFWWGFSVQDGLIPLMAFTAQLFFGRRAYILYGRKKWFLAVTIVMPCLTMIAGVGLAVTARIWVLTPSPATARIGPPSFISALLWMIFSAATDGSITLLLLYRFMLARRSLSAHPSRSARRTLRTLIHLTLETVLLTHLIGASMCVIFLAAPAHRRTGTDIFWVLLEIVTEMYALSILFTINSRKAMSLPPKPARAAEEPQEEGSGMESTLDLESQSALDRRVEGHQHTIEVHSSMMGGAGQYGARTWTTSPLADSQSAALTSTSGERSDDGTGRQGTGSGWTMSPPLLLTPGDEEAYTFNIPMAIMPMQEDGKGGVEEDVDKKEDET